MKKKGIGEERLHRGAKKRKTKKQLEGHPDVLGSKSHLGPDPDHIWDQDCATSGSGTQLHQGPRPNHIWDQDPITSWSGTQSHLSPGPKTQSHQGPGPNHIWDQDRITSGTRTESHLGPGPNHIWEIYMEKHQKCRSDWCSAGPTLCPSNTPHRKDWTNQFWPNFKLQQGG